MQTRTPFLKGDKLRLLIHRAKEELAFDAVVRQPNPLTVEIRSSPDDEALAALKVGACIVGAYPQKGLAYKFDVKKAEGRTLQLELISRYEMRDYVRVEVVVSLGYEIVGRADESDEAEERNDKEFIDAESITKAGVLDQPVAELISTMCQEIKTLRDQVQAKAEYESAQVSPQHVSLSGSGIRFVSHLGIGLGDILRLSLSLPDMERPILSTGRVVRVETGGKPGKGTGVACRFLDLSDGDREAIIRFVFQTQRQMLRRMKLLS